NVCPSEIHSVVRVGTPSFFPPSYAFNGGTWKLFTHATNLADGGESGDGAFAPNSAFKPADFTDGLSHTLAFSEVKTYTPNNGNGHEGTDTPPDSIAGFTAGKF